MGEWIARRDNGRTPFPRRTDETAAGGTRCSGEGFAHGAPGEQENLEDLREALHRHIAARFSHQRNPAEDRIDGGGSPAESGEEPGGREEQEKARPDPEHGQPTVFEGAEIPSLRRLAVETETPEGRDREGRDGNGEVDQEKRIGETLEDLFTGAVDAAEVFGEMSESLFQLSPRLGRDDDLVFEGRDKSARPSQSIADAASVLDPVEEATVEMSLVP